MTTFPPPDIFGCMPAFGLIFGGLFFSFAASSHMGSYGKPAVFYQGEMVPAHKTEIEFRFPQCGTDSRLLSLSQRESEALLPSTETGQKEPVRYVNLVGRLSDSLENCSESVKEVSLVYEIKGDSRRMTHFFVAVEAPAKIHAVKTRK